PTPAAPCSFPALSAVPAHLRPFPPRRSSDLPEFLLTARGAAIAGIFLDRLRRLARSRQPDHRSSSRRRIRAQEHRQPRAARRHEDRKSTRLNSSHVKISYAVFCLEKKRYRSY